MSTLDEKWLSPDLVTTDAAKKLLARPVFPAIGTKPRPLGGHVAVNGHDLAAVEAEAFERGRQSVKVPKVATPPEPTPEPGS